LFFLRKPDDQWESDQKTGKKNRGGKFVCGKRGRGVVAVGVCNKEMRAAPFKIAEGRVGWWEVPVF